MADQKISQLTPGAPAQANDLIPVARGGTNVSLKVSDILNEAGSIGLPLVVPAPSINSQTGDYTVQSSDNGKVIKINAASDKAVTLDSGLTAPFFTTIFAIGGGNPTLTPSSGLINGQALYKLFTVPVVDLSVVDTNGTAVTWISGPQFTAEMEGAIVFIGPSGNGLPFLVQTFNSVTSLTLAATAGSQSGINFTFNGNPCVGLAFDGTNWFVSLVPPNQQPWIWIQDANGHYRAAITVDEATSFNEVQDPTNGSGQGNLSFNRPVLFNPSGRTPSFGANGVWAVYYEPIVNAGATYGLATQIEVTVPVGSKTVYNGQLTGLYSEMDINGNPTLLSAEGSSCVRGTVSDLRGNNVDVVSSQAVLSGVSAAYDRNSTTLDMSQTTAAAFSGTVANEVDGEIGSGIFFPVYRGQMSNQGNSTTGKGAIYHAGEIQHQFPEANYAFYTDGPSSRDVHDFAFYADLGPSSFRSLVLFAQIGVNSDYVPTIDDNFVGFGGSGNVTCYLPIAYPLGAIWAGETCDTNGIDVTNPVGSFQFVKAMVGGKMIINGVTYTVASFVSGTHITLTTSAGVQTSAPFDVIPSVPLHFELTIANESAGLIFVTAPLGAVQPIGNTFLQPGQTMKVRVSGSNGTWYIVSNGGPQTAPAQYTVATLPSGVEGWTAYATDGRKVGEGAGTGTGVPIYYSSGNWRVYSTDAPVAA